MTLLAGGGLGRSQGSESYQGDLDMERHSKDRLQLLHSTSVLASPCS